MSTSTEHSQAVEEQVVTTAPETGPESGTGPDPGTQQAEEVEDISIDDTALVLDVSLLDDIDDDAFDPDAADAGRSSKKAASNPTPNVPDVSVFRPRPKTRPFEAELDVAELDDRDRPGPAWAARAIELSGSNIVLESRRMCYVGKHILIAVHLIDDEPVPLAGVVHSCEYAESGQYVVDVDLERFPDDSFAHTWLKERQRD
ncbi:MAG: hypothetical protein AAGI17_00925 [Planctomycetota bacterium]